MPRAKSITELLAACERKPNGCLEWARGRTPEGYGQAWDNGTNAGAHRRFWEIVHGPIPPGMFVCHHCDNPACVEVDHMFVGTNSDNQKDAWRKGRSGLQRMTPEQLREYGKAGARAITPEMMREIHRKRSLTMTPERYRVVGLKAAAARTPEQRSESARKRQEALGSERRKAAAHKAWKVRRARYGSNGMK